jgi:hypothetical protein
MHVHPLRLRWPGAARWHEPHSGDGTSAWVREEVTANTCFSTADKVRAHVDPFFAGLAARTDEVKQRCRTELQRRADALDATRAATTMPHDVRKAA